MTKQKNLLGWINTYLTERFIANPKELPSDECFTEAEAILQYLHSQGVVIELPYESPEGCHLARTKSLIEEE